MDIDDQLEMLQRELMATQEEKTNPLSERTVAEIMVKLYHEGFAFIPTTDGNEYVTPAQLDQEISTLVRERGKIAITILPQLLNIGAEAIEARLNHILHKWPVTRHTANLFSQRYFDGMLAGLAQRLEEEGRIDMEQIAVEHQLKLDFALKLITDNLHKLKAELDGKQLITKEYTLLKKAKILGFLSAIKKPLQIDILYKTVETEAKTSQKLILELLDENKLKGSLSSNYFIPASFTLHQKTIIMQYFDNNGYLDAAMIQKKFMIAKPDEWIERNLGKKFVRIDNFYFKQDKLQSLATQLNSLLKTEGFVDLSSVLPIAFEEQAIHVFLKEKCGLQEYFLCYDYCYSNEWLEQVAKEFKPKIIHNIFFKKTEPKGGKDQKKKGRKEKVELVTEEELQEVLFNCGYADYNMAENLAPELLELLLVKLQDLQKKTEKELAQSKGMISGSLLKYKSCKTILRTEERLSTMVNIVQKQIKKGQQWVDGNFGVNQTDPKGMYAAIYYDNVLPKGWPTMDTLKWQEVTPSQLLAPQPEREGQAWPMKKCMLTPLCQLLAFHNKSQGFPLPLPELQPLKEESAAPFIYQFFISQKDKRYILVDNLLPFVEGISLASLGPYALLQKAYAKLRYCYKGILAVGINQMLLQLTGQNSIRYSGDTEKDRSNMVQLLQTHLVNGDFIVIMAEGQADKKLKTVEDQLELYSLKPYLISGNSQQLQLYPSKLSLPLKQVVDLFRNIFVIKRPS